MTFEILNQGTGVWVDVLQYQENDTLDVGFKTVSGPNERIVLTGETRPDPLADKLSVSLVTKALAETDAKALQNLLFVRPIQVRTDYATGTLTTYTMRWTSFAKPVFKSRATGDNWVKISAQLEEL